MSPYRRLTPAQLDTVTELEHACRAAAEAEAEVERKVRHARADGISWEVIGHALGISRQTAHAKFTARGIN